MKIANVTQGSPEWHAFRAEHFTASDAPAMMGASKYKSRNELLREAIIGAAPVDEFTQALFDKGHKAEEMARPIAEEIIGDELFPVTGWEDETGLDLSASFDGLTMDGRVGFEHKLYSESTAAQIREAKDLGLQALDRHFVWQLEQQILVSKCDKILFMCSDGTTERCEWIFYRSQGLAQMLVDGWRQFKHDLENAEIEAPKQAPEAQKIEAFPALRLSVVGSVNGSNLGEYKEKALAFVESIKTDLSTDQDFADAEATVKFCKKAETELKAAKEKALNDTADIAELFQTVDELAESLRQKRLALDKKVKAEKERIKLDIVKSRQQTLDFFADSLTTKSMAYFGAFVKPVSDFAGAIKGKKTVETITNAADDHLAACKIKAKRQAEIIEANLQAIPLDREHLFPDVSEICEKAEADFANLVQARVAEAEAKEKARKEAEEKAKQEAEEKAAAKPAEQAIEQDFDKVFKPSEKPAQVAQYRRRLTDFDEGYIQALKDHKDAIGRDKVEAIIQNIKEKGAA